MALPALSQLSPPSIHPSLLVTIPSPPANIPCTTNSNNTNLSLKRVDQLFDETPRREDDDGDVVSWTSSIARSCRNGHLSKAASSLTRMRLSNIEPNDITFVTLLSACSHSKSLRFGLSIHAYLLKLGWDDTNVVLVTALVDMYAKCGIANSARRAFDGMKVKNSVSWNTMIDGYMRNGQVEAAVALFDSAPRRDKVSWTAMIGGFVKNDRFEEALECFRGMQLAGVDPDYVTIVAVLAACANLGALGQGFWLHSYVIRRDFGEKMRLSNSLIDLYARCGCINFALEVFDGMPKRSLVSWNSLIVGFAVNGHAENAIEYFSLMQKAGFKPDSISFTGALTACSHAGLVDEGLHYYNEMTRVYGISPQVEHYGCLVDLLSRAGQLEAALDVVETMPMRPNEVVLGSLLAACRSRGDVALAERVMSYIAELKRDTDSNYVLLSNIYAAVGRWDGVGKVRHAMKALDIRKRPGYSAIEIDSSSHEFVAGDRTHVQSDDIYEMLDQLSLELKQYGYVPETVVSASTKYQ
ncbi:hypothetical protein AAC387_Pa07g0251 [Persea americana]